MARHHHKAPRSPNPERTRQPRARPRRKTEPKEKATKGTAQKNTEPKEKATKGAAQKTDEPAGKATKGSAEKRDTTTPAKEKSASDKASPSDSATKAGTQPRAQLSEQQQTRVRETVLKQRGGRITNVNFSITVGTRVPRSVQLAVLPAAVIEVVPEYRSYRYVVVRDDIVIIDPGTTRSSTSCRDAARRRRWRWPGGSSLSGRADRVRTAQYRSEVGRPARHRRHQRRRDAGSRGRVARVPGRGGREAAASCAPIATWCTRTTSPSSTRANSKVVLVKENRH